MSFVIREAVEAEIPALARLHVATWNQTYPGVPSPPSVALRERQWREAFAAADGSWFFCYVVEAPDGELAGFAKGIRYTEPEPPGYDGELSKIYVLRAYHGLGMGRRLLGRVARRFLEQGITSMLVFGEDGNRSCSFYAAMGGEKLRAADGTPAACNYGWRDLRVLASICPSD